MDSEETGQQLSSSAGRDWTLHVAEHLEDWHKRCYAARSARALNLRPLGS